MQVDSEGDTTPLAAQVVVVFFLFLIEKIVCRAVVYSLFARICKRGGAAVVPVEGERYRSPPHPTSLGPLDGTVASVVRDTEIEGTADEEKVEVAVSRFKDTEPIEVEDMQ